MKDSSLALFTEKTEQLENAYRKLQGQCEKMRTKLETSHQTLEQMITHMSDGLVFVTQNGEISLYNPAAASILEIPQTATLGERFWKHFSDSLFGFSLEQALKTESIPGRIFLTLSNGKEIEVAPAIIPTKGLLLLLNDRSELKQLEKSVQQSDRLRELGEVAATLAHEIRNPLGGVEGFASLLKRELKDPDHKRMVEAILEGTHALNSLITNVLEYTRPLILHFAPVLLSSLLFETEELSQANGYPFRVRIEKEHILSIDPKRMQFALLNLIRNSYEAQATKVEALLTKEGNILVKDNGEGITQEQLKKIFKPFFTTKAKGTGLGLSEAYKIIQAHGGSMTVDSKLGKGTCITIEYVY